MKSKKSPLLITAAVCLILLALLSSGYSLAVSLGVLRGGTAVNPLMTGRRLGNFPQGDFEGTPGQFPKGFQDRGDGIMPFGTAATGVFGIIRWLGLGLNIVALFLSVMAVVGILKGKKWGAVWAIILAVLFALTSVTGLSRFGNWISFTLSLVRVLLAIAVIVLLLLPNARKVYNPILDNLDDDL